MKAPGDHPRMGGEKSALRISSGGRPGSPPHGRGKAAHELRTLPRAGITPAWAGKSISVPSIQSGAGDHPRMGGEKAVFDIFSCQSRGSPPHGRGKVFLAGGFFVLTGITPAWAGKRRKKSEKHTVAKDHPRMGGEKTKKIP